MSVHTLHPSIREHGLGDGCPRCAEHAEDPVAGLDDANLRDLIARTRRWMSDEDFPRSDTEQDAMRKIEGHLRFQHVVERLWREAAEAAQEELLRAVKT